MQSKGTELPGDALKSKGGAVRSLRCGAKAKPGGAELAKALLCDARLSWAKAVRRKAVSREAKAMNGAEGSSKGMETHGMEPKTKGR